MNTKLPKIVVSALVQKDDRVLLVKEKLEDAREYWIIPGGKVEFGESLHEAVHREMREELDLQVEIQRLLDFKEAIHVAHDYHTLIFFFLATPCNAHVITDEKILDAQFFSRDEIAGLPLVDSAQWLLERYFESAGV